MIAAVEATAREGKIGTMSSPFTSRTISFLRSYLRYKQFLAGRELDAGVATSPDFYPELIRTFRAAVPLVRFLNAAIATSSTLPPALVGGPDVRRRRLGRPA